MQIKIAAICNLHKEISNIFNNMTAVTDACMPVLHKQGAFV